MAARRTAAAAVLADYRTAVASAPLTRPPGREWMFRLADALGGVLDQADAEGTAELADDDGTEPYCTTCGQWAGMFLGMEGWHHFRGDPSPGGQRSLYDAGHAAVIAWCRPPGLALSPAGLSVFAAALSDAITHRDPTGQCTACEAEYGGLCYYHAGDLDKTDAYLALARQLGIEVDR
jgi:hypothetical protein